jgi:hypothetical protein
MHAPTRRTLAVGTTGLTNPGISADGAQVTAGAQTMTAECAVLAGTTDASFVQARFTALKVGQVH